MQIATKLLHKGDMKMKNIKKQVVIVDNCSSPYIYQAILILNDSAPSSDEKIIEDAEKIVSNFLQHNKKITYKKKSSVLPFFLIFAAILFVGAAVLSYII